MHKEAWEFVLEMIGKHKLIRRDLKVLEFGARNHSKWGNFKRVFPEITSEFVGLDNIDGEGVDVVGLMHEYQDKPDGYFDVVVSTETLEHDCYWEKSVKRMIELTKQGGALILTAAGANRGQHHLSHSPTKDYYGGVLCAELVTEALKHGKFEVVEMRCMARRFQDVCLYLGRKFE